MEELIKCKLCSAASHLRFQVKEYIQHIKLFHAHQTDFKIICGIRGCKRTYNNPGTFFNHVYAMHGEDDCEDIPVNNVSMDCDEDNNNDDDDDYSDYDDIFMDQRASKVSSIHDSQSSYSKEIVQKSSAIFLLGLKEKFKLTQLSLQGVIQGVTALTQQNISMLKSQVCTYLYFNKILWLCVSDIIFSISGL